MGGQRVPQAMGTFAPQTPVANWSAPPRVLTPSLNFGLVRPSQNAHGNQLSTGQRITIHGLMARPELNGCKGRLTEFDTEAQRWLVQLAKQAGTCRLKPDNLQLADKQESSDDE